VLIRNSIAADLAQTGRHLVGRADQLDLGRHQPSGDEPVPVFRTGG
jgi:hypothetical protein